jgi:hypothetical protein
MPLSTLTAGAAAAAADVADVGNGGVADDVVLADAAASGVDVGTDVACVLCVVPTTPIGCPPRPPTPTDVDCSVASSVQRG